MHRHIPHPGRRHTADEHGRGAGRGDEVGRTGTGGHVSHAGRTVGSPIDTIGPPTCGTSTVTCGQTCMSVSLAAGCPMVPSRSGVAFHYSTSPRDEGLRRLRARAPLNLPRKGQRHVAWGVSPRWRNSYTSKSPEGATAAHVAANEWPSPLRGSCGGLGSFPGAHALPVIHISVSEGDWGTARRAGFVQPGVSTPGEQIPKSSQALKGSRFFANRPPLRGLGTSRTPVPAVETAGFSKPALWAIPLPLTQRCV
jgi:hypothetical protein